MIASDMSSTTNLSWEHYFIKTRGGLGVKYQYKDLSVVELPEDLPQPPSDYPVMFSGCHHLVNIDALAKWDASTMTKTTGMFNHCRSLKDISPLKHWNMSNVTDMSHMFNCCYILNDVSAIISWDISKVKRMNCIFNGCNELPDFARLEVYDQQTFNGFIERYLIEPITSIPTQNSNECSDALYTGTSIEEEEEEYEELNDLIMTLAPGMIQRCLSDDDSY
jgi:surface protein